MTVRRYSGKMYCSTDSLIVGFKGNMVSGEDYDQLKAAYDLLNAQVTKSAATISGIAERQAKDIALIDEKVTGLIELAEGLQVDANRWHAVKGVISKLGHVISDEYADELIKARKDA